VSDEIGGGGERVSRAAGFVIDLLGQPSAPALFAICGGVDLGLGDSAGGRRPQIIGIGLGPCS